MIVKSKLYIVLISILVFSSCASLKSISITQIPLERSRIVTAEVHDWVVLGFKFNNDFIDGLHDKLHKQCPNGKVEGIVTKHVGYRYFIVYKRQVTVRAFCVEGRSDTKEENIYGG